MPAVSQKQQEFFGMVSSGKIPRPKGMTDEQVDHFAKTSRKGLPKRNNARRHKIAAIRAGK